MLVPGQLSQHAPAPTPTPTETKMKRFVGALTTGIPCILETRVGVGLLAAVVERPASAHLVRVAEPARTSARDITLGLSAKLCCITRTSPPHVVDMSFLTCNLCRRNTNGRTVYLYMSMGFCSRGCREDYHLGEMDKQNRKRQAVALMGRSKMARILSRVDAGKAMEEAGEVSCSRPTFFTFAEEAE